MFPRIVGTYPWWRSWPTPEARPEVEAPAVEAAEVAKKTAPEEAVRKVAREEEGEVVLGGIPKRPSLTATDLV